MESLAKTREITFSTKSQPSKLACVASVSNRVIARKLERKQKKRLKGEGERRRGRGSFIPLPLPRHLFFFCPCASFLDEPREETLATQATSKSATPKTSVVLWGNNVYFFRFLLRHQLVESPRCLDLVSFSVPIRVDWEKSIMRLSNFNFR